LVARAFALRLLCTEVGDQFISMNANPFDYDRSYTVSRAAKYEFAVYKSRLDTILFKFGQKVIHAHLISTSTSKVSSAPHPELSSMEVREVREFGNSG
jgi:hypothetical protein